VPEPQRHGVLGYFDTRFGISLRAFDDYALLQRHRLYSLLSATPHVAALARLQVHAVGLPILRIIRHHLKPTTVALQRFGLQATRHVLDLTDTQVRLLLQERALSMELSLQPGYVILQHAGAILGCGLYTPGCLRSQLPKHPMTVLES